MWRKFGYEMGEADELWMMEGRSMELTAESSLALSLGRRSCRTPRHEEKRGLERQISEQVVFCTRKAGNSKVNYGMSGLRNYLLAVDWIWDRKPGNLPRTILCCR